MAEAGLVQHAVASTPCVRAVNLLQHIRTALLSFFSTRGQHSIEVSHGAAGSGVGGLCGGTNVPLCSVAEAISTAAQDVGAAIDLLHEGVAPVAARIRRALCGVKKCEILWVALVKRQGFVFGAGQRLVRDVAELAQLHTAYGAREGSILVGFDFI